MSSASSVTRKISISSDNIYLMIRNSNGKYWEATTANIQKAINDLNNKSGIVWLPGNKSFYLTKTIIVWNNIILDLDGAELKLPNGINTNVVELKDGSGIQNGVIDVSGHQARFKTGEWRYTSNTSFNRPYACIFLNASSMIHSAHIENMAICSISDGYESEPHNPYIFYSSNYTGRGYGIHLYASNTNVPQLINNVTVESVHTRGFHTVIFIHNERNPSGGQNGAHIDGNTFERFFSSGDSYFLNISRNPNADKQKCTTSGNVVYDVQYQATKTSYWGGDWICWMFLRTDGDKNIFKHFSGWDMAWYCHTPKKIVFTSDSSNCYIIGRCLLTENCTDNGIDNIRVDLTDSFLYIGSIITKE